VTGGPAASNPMAEVYLVGGAYCLTGNEMASPGWAARAVVRVRKDEVPRQAGRLREEAAWHGITLSALAEADLGVPLEPPRAQGELPELPRCDSGGALVDLAHREALYRAMVEPDRRR